MAPTLNPVKPSSKLRPHQAVVLFLCACDAQYQLLLCAPYCVLGNMLRLMAGAPGEPVPRERFLDVVWGYTAFPTTRTVDNHIASLRSKLERDPEEPRWIKTVHGIGYKLEL